MNHNPHSNPPSLLADLGVGGELIEPDGVDGVVDHPRNIHHVLEMSRIHPDLLDDSETEKITINIVVIVNAIKNLL